MEHPCVSLDVPRLRTQPVALSECAMASTKLRVMDPRLTDDFDPLAAEDLISAHDLYRDTARALSGGAQQRVERLLGFAAVSGCGQRTCASRIRSSPRFKTWSRR